MKTFFILLSVLTVLFTVAPNSVIAQKTKTTKAALTKITTVKMPEALAEQLARDDNGKNKSCQLCGLLDDVDWSIKWITTLEADLNGDGNPEWILSYCGNHACSGWIYRKEGKKYQMIYASNIDEPTILSTSSNGYRDLSGGIYDYGETLKFDGKRYKQTECRKYKLITNREGNILSRKLISRGPCNN
jgi:hypothetical protein